jgi:hypothetical protein
VNSYVRIQFYHGVDLVVPSACIHHAPSYNELMRVVRLPM